ncbi:hypothetical protein [Streptomyces sp. NPDC058695]|uniref:hypothetical protein n=1 Tax=Streptomyces sp. NPDC058695 TaxID=3346604 RepID=UPI0036686153
MRITFAAPARGLAHRSVQADPAAGDHQREPVATGGERSSAHRPNATAGAGGHHRPASARVMCHMVRVSLINADKRPWDRAVGVG